MSSSLKVHEMVADLKTVLLDQLPRLNWMDETTRSRARDKVNAVIDRIAYPEELRDDVKMNALFEKVFFSGTCQQMGLSNFEQFCNFVRYFQSL